MADLFSVETMAWVLPILLPVAFFVYMVLNDSLNAKKAVVLKYDSEKQAVLVDKKVVDGIISIKDDKYYVDEHDATLIRGTGYIVKSFRPFYVIKHDRVLPQTFGEKGIEELSPQNLKKLMDNKILSQLLTPQDAGKMQIMMVFIGVVLGAMVMYMAVSQGWIKIGG